MPLDDLQAMGVYQASLHKPERIQVAFRLAPDVLGVQLGWFTALIDSNRLPEARGLLHAMKQSKVNGSMTEWCEAEIELHGGDLKGAINRLEKAVKVDTTSGNLRLLLGYAYAKDGKLSLARDAYQQALGCLLHQDDVIGARQSLLEVDKALGTTGNR